MKPVLALLTILWCLGARLQADTAKQGYHPKECDVVFQSLPHNDLVDAIEGVSDSKISHCGIVVKRKGDWFVLEALNTVHETPLQEWMVRGRLGWVLVCRLKARYTETIPAFIQTAESFSGRPYDYHYSFDDEHIYCSELVFKAAQKAIGRGLGETKRLGDLNWKPDEAFIRSVEDGNLPLDREMITPVELSRAPEFEKVYETGG